MASALVGIVREHRIVECFLPGMLGKEVGTLLLAVDASEEALHLHLALELIDGVYHGLGAGGTAGAEHIDRHDILDTLCHVV